LRGEIPKGTKPEAQKSRSIEHKENKKKKVETKDWVGGGTTSRAAKEHKWQWKENRGCKSRKKKNASPQLRCRRQRSVEKA